MQKDTSRPHTASRLKMLLTIGCIALASGCAATIGPDAGPEVYLPDVNASRLSEARNISGVWWTDTYTPRLLPIGGGEPPLTDEGKAYYEKYKTAFAARTFEDPMKAKGVISYAEFVEALRKGPVTELKTHDPDFRPRVTSDPKNVIDATLRRCVAPGVPRIMAAPYPFRIMQTPSNLVTIAYEMSRVVRQVRLDARHANIDAWAPSYSGESVGWWEGDTLVIDTINFNDLTTLDRSGLPHSDELRVVERLRKINGGKQLEALITISDPVMYTKPWTTRLVYQWRPDVQPVTDWVCNETHRDLSSIKGIDEGLQELARAGGGKP